jgi:hypothetical protein
MTPRTSRHPRRVSVPETLELLTRSGETPRVRRVMSPANAVCTCVRWLALERWHAGLDTGEMFAKLPDGACQEQHWGCVLSGRVTMRYTDGPAETLSAGQAYYIRPGHNAHVDEDVELVEFTPADHTPGINTLES